MTTATLSSKGQLVIPSEFRRKHHLKAGDSLIIEDSEDGIIIRKTEEIEKKHPISSLFGSIGYSGKPKSIDDMENGIAQGIAESWKQ